MEDNSDRTGHIPAMGNLRLPQQSQQYNPYLNMFGERGDSQYAPTFIGANAGVPVSNNAGVTFGYNTLRSPYMDPRSGFNVGYEYTGRKGNQTSFNVGRSGQGQTTIGARIGFKNGGSWLSNYKMGGNTTGPDEPYHPITNPTGYHPQNVLDKIQKLPNKEKRYEPSQMVNDAKSFLGAADLSTAFSGSPLAQGVNLLTRVANATGDGYTGLRYAMDGQYGQGGVDAAEALIDLMPYRQGNKVLNLRKNSGLPAVYNKMSKLDKSLNTGLKVGKSAATADDFMHSSMGKFLFGNPDSELIQNKFGGGMFPEYHSYAPPRMDDGGESWLSNYARGGISGSTYEIQSGDTLSDIAERSGVSMDELAALNNIKDVNRIYANQTLNLGTNANRPAMTATVPAPARVNKPAATPVNPAVQNMVSPRNFQKPAVKPTPKPAAKPVQRAMIQPTTKPVVQPVANPSAFKGNYVKGQRLANWKDSRNLESGVVTDKGTNTQYVIQNRKVVKSYPVMTGQGGKNKDTDVNKNTASLAYLAAHPEARSTPTGTYFLQPNSNIYGSPGYDMNPIPAYGFNAPEARQTAMHIPYGTGPKGSHGYDPAEGARRLHALATPTPKDNYGSYGCVNTPSGELKCLTESMFPQGDTAIVIDSRFGKDKNFLQNKFNVKPRKMGGESCYECGGMYANGGEGGPGWGDAAWTAAQIADPTGILSYGDAYRGWRDMVRNPSLGNFGMALLNTAAALPVVGKPAKAAVVAGKTAKAWKELNALQKTGRVLNRTIVNPVRTLDRGVGHGAAVEATTAKLLGNAPKVVKNYVLPMTTAVNRGVRWDKLMSPLGNATVEGIASGLDYTQQKLQGQKYGGQTNWLNNYK